jgi:predicted RNA methylase
MTALIERATIDQIAAARVQCLDLYAQAFDLVAAAGRAADTAAPSQRANLPHLQRPDRSRYSPGPLADFLTETRQDLDRAIWSHLIRATQFDRLMDKAAKDEFSRTLERDPPEATAENCRAMFDQLAADSGQIFRRGVANAFSGLDRRFRSHDGFKIGDRIVLTWFADGDGYVSHGGRRDTLQDVERAFYVLDGKAPPDGGGGILAQLALAKPPGFRAAAYEAQTEYLRAKVFKNGNAHIWFLRDDLLERVNLLLADWYGAALGAGCDAADPAPGTSPGRPPAKNFGFFETPPDLAERVASAAGLWRDPRAQSAPLRVLEPSAGRGALARAVKAGAPDASICCVEIQPGHVDHLRGLGLGPVWAGDFLSLSPDGLGKFDRIVMNPPFDGQRDVDHVSHALRFLAPGGRLVAIMSAGAEFRQDAKAQAFRAQVERYKGEFRDLPAGSFASAGTNVNTVLLTLDAPRA